MVLYLQFTAELLNDHLWYGQTEPNTILINILFDIKLFEHSAYRASVFDAYALVYDFDLDPPSIDGSYALGLQLNHTSVRVFDGIGD